MFKLAASPLRELQPLDVAALKKMVKERRGNLKSRLRACQPPTAEELHVEEPSQWALSLDRLLASKCGTEIFRAFLESEFSDENIEFWRVCEDYKKIKSSLRMSCRARMIFKRYIEAEAVREINIDHKTRDAIRRNVKTPTTVCFDDAQRIVYSLMEKDSYPRFLVSDLYRALLLSMSEPMKT